MLLFHLLCRQLPSFTLVTVPLSLSPLLSKSNYLKLLDSSYIVPFSFAFKVHQSVRIHVIFCCLSAVAIKKNIGSQTPCHQVHLTASITMGTSTDKAKLHSDIMTESNAKEASVNKPAEKQAVKGDALASTILPQAASAKA